MAVPEDKKEQYEIAAQIEKGYQEALIPETDWMFLDGIVATVEHKCSECGKTVLQNIALDDYDAIEEYHYCPFCGKRNPFVKQEGR